MTQSLTGSYTCKGDSEQRPGSALAHVGKRVLTISAGVVLSLPALVGCGILSSTSSGCTERDEQLSVDIANLAVLDQRPPDAEITDRYSGCDGDSGFAYAGRLYRSDVNRDRILAFYREAAPKDGWTLVAENPAPSSDGLAVTTARLCFDKEINGTTAHLGVSWRSDLKPPADPGGPAPSPEPEDQFGLEVTASHDGDAWC
jgi:hypothetical protein